MFRRINDFNSVPALQQLKKIEEEFKEFEIEVVKGNEEGQRMEGADLIQSVLTFFNNKGYTLNDYERMFKDLYVKESKRGRVVTCLDGETHKDLVIADLLNVIAKKDNEIKTIKAWLRFLTKDRSEEIIEGYKAAAPDKED